MPSREEIIKSLEGCMDVHRSGLWSSGCMSCAYEKRSNPKCFMDLTKDVIELLKEQEPKLVELHTNAYGTRFYFCPKCKRELFHTRDLNFCEKCGQAVKWDAES